jgi:hypothetical protein
MKAIRFAVVGLVVQALGLASFILISRTSVAAVGKPAVIGLMLTGIALLLWREIKQAKTPVTLLQFPVLLALGYAIAFHLVGAVGFRGLVRDVEFSGDYLLSVLSTTGVVFVVYAIAAALLYFLDKMLRAR